MPEENRQVRLHIQDLAGFFVSIPMDRFLLTTKILLAQAYDLALEDVESELRGVFMTVDMSGDTACRRLFRGRYCTSAPKTYVVDMSMFLRAVEVSFKFSLFTVGSQVLEQVRGAPMGSPFSPAICHAVVSLFEHRYFSKCLLNPLAHSRVGWIGRYVDNRLSLLAPTLEQFPEVQAFLHEEVYGPPVMLEYEDGDVFLGFHVRAANLQISFAQPRTTPGNFFIPNQQVTSRRCLVAFDPECT